MPSLSLALRLVTRGRREIPTPIVASMLNYVSASVAVDRIKSWICELAGARSAVNLGAFALLGVWYGILRHGGAVASPGMRTIEFNPDPVSTCE